jgi:hypothetical protein
VARASGPGRRKRHPVGAPPLPSTGLDNSIAWQVGAAAAGGSGISALIGLLVDTTSLAILGPALLMLVVLLVLAHAALARLAPTPAPDGPRQ